MKTALPNSSDRVHSGIDVFGNPGLRHRDAGIAQGDGAAQAVDQAQHVFGAAEDPHAGVFGNPQQFEPIQRVGAVLGADLLDDEAIQSAQVVSVEQQAPVLEVEFDPAHVDDQAEARAPFDCVGEGLGGPFAGYADDADPGFSQRKSPLRES